MNLLSIYDRLFAYFGPRDWWPADSPYEVIVGAILTQSAAWTNVEKAITRLKEEHMLSQGALLSVSEQKLASVIRSAGYHNAKAKKLKSFAEFLKEKHHGELASLFSLDADDLRDELLSVWGIGPETADSIVLYAAGKPSFVVDAYTRRIFSRLGLVDEQVSYDVLKAFFEDNLPCSVLIFNEYHALIVELGKTCCRKKPKCGICPLKGVCGFCSQMTK
jgi:endonuclease III related protein